MKKWVILLLLTIISFILAGCSTADIETVDIGTEPPKVMKAQMPYVDTNPTIFADTVGDSYSFELYETYFYENRNGVILECEIADDGTLLKYEIDDSDSEYKGKGDYLSTTITQVKVLKVHYKGDLVGDSIKEGIVLPLEEPYFKVTSDMEEAIESYHAGTYVTVRNYYPMIKGQRYVIYGTISEFEYRDIKYEQMLFPYDNSSVVCLTENGLHAYRREHYSPRDMIQYIGIWLKYSGKDTFDYIYENEIDDNLDKINDFNIHNLSPEKNPEQVGVKEKNKYVTNLSEKNGVVFSCELIDSGEQIRNTNGIPSLAEYDYFTKTKVKIKNIYFTGENVPENIEYGMEIYLYEPYFSVTEDMEDFKEQYGENALITYDGYYPMTNLCDKNGTVEFLLYCCFEELNDTYVLVPVDNSPAIPCVSEYDDIMDIPMRMQVELGPIGILNYLESYMSPGLYYIPII